MSGVLITAFVVVHICFWISPDMDEPSSGGANCGDVGALACGNPVLHDIVEAVDNFGGTSGGIFSILAFFLKALGLVVTGFIKLAFFNYPWLNGGGQIIDIIVMMFRLVMGAVFFGVVGKIAINAVGGRLAR